MKRLVTAVIMLAACAAAMVLLPNPAWAGLLLLVAFGAAWEWGTLAGYPPAACWVFCGITLAAAWALYSAGGAWAERAAYAASCAFWILVVPVWLLAPWRGRKPAAMAVAGLVVLVPTWLAIARLQADPAGLLQLLGIVWVSDTGAYWVGSRWGRHKLAPRISPGKTWEGVAGAAATVAVYYGVLFVTGFARPWAAGWSGVVLFAAVATISIVGDLLESWVKRCAGVKDSGALLPGHGGILDRIDGLTAGMPLAALIMGYMSR